MNVVSFPGIGIDFEVPKIAFTVLGVDIYMYAVCIVVGIIVAMIFCKFSEDNYYINFECVIEIMLLAIVFGIIGARLYYVIFNFSQYAENLGKIFDLRDGGLALYGGFIAGTFIIVKFSKKYKVSPIEFLDYIVPFVALAQCIGRWGNFFNVEAYGIQTTSLLRMGINTVNGYMEVHPMFLYESAATLIIFFILRNLQSKRKFPGQILYSYLVLYSGVRMFLEGLRADSLMFLGIRISKVLSIIVFVCASIILLKKIVNYSLKQFRQRKVK